MAKFTPPTSKWILVARLLLVLAVSASCTFFQAGAPQPRAEQSSAGGGTTAGDPPTGDAAGAEEEFAAPDVDELEVRMMEEGYQPPSYPSVRLGSISFAKDSPGAVERALSPEDGEASLQVVDAAGLTWTLHIPTGALYSAETLRMVPLAQLDGSQISETAGEVIGGISLEPDGLTFRLPVQLSVRAAALQGPTLLLSGSGSGAEIEYAPPAAGSADPAAGILHFSTYFASALPDPLIGKINREAWTEYKALAEEAKQLLKSPLEIPVPPDIPIDCPKEDSAKENNATLEKFIQQAQNPEMELISKMLIQWRRIALTTEENVEGIPGLVQRLGGRVVRKAQVMIKTYYGSEEKLTAVATFALRSARALVLLSGDHTAADTILSQLAEWYKGLIDPMLTDIKKNHNYKRIPTAVMVAYNASLLGLVDYSGEFLEKLRDVMRFEAKFTLTIENPEIQLTQATEAVVPMQFEPTYGWIYRCYGEGTGKPTKAEMLTDWGTYTISMFQYPVKASLVDFDPCKGTVKLGIDQFGSQKDTNVYVSPDGVTSENSWTLAFDAGESDFEGYRKDGGFYMFEVPVRNGMEEAVNEIIEPPVHDYFSVVLEIQLTHK